MFNRPNTSSYQILRPPKVLAPLALSFIDLIRYLLTILPNTVRPFMAKSAKLKSNNNLRAWLIGLKAISTNSASLFGFAVKYNTLLFGAPVVKSYSLSRVIPNTLKRFP